MGWYTSVWTVVALVHPYSPTAPPKTPHQRLRAPRMQEPPTKENDPFYAEVPAPRAFSDYEWDESFPGTLKPGLAKDNYDMDEVMQAWEGKEFEAVLELSMDEQFHVPIKPPERILDWLERVGLLSDEDEDAPQPDDEKLSTSGLLDEEFDLEGEEMVEPPILDIAKDQGATMSDFL